LLFITNTRLARAKDVGQSSRVELTNQWFIKAAKPIEAEQFDNKLPTAN